ncbi:MAG: hypothetical protein WC699_13330 [Bacteroidales bacterium]|jgi:hypothetical protein
MKARLLTLVIFSVLTIGISIESRGQASGGIGFFCPGIHTIQYSQLNDYLPSGYPVISNKPFVTAGSGYGIFSNFVIGGEGGTTHAGSFTNSSNQVVDLAGGFGFFSLGYVVFNNKGILAFPTVSIGSNDLEMYVHQKDLNPSFLNVVSEPFQATTIRYSTKLLKFSLAGLYTLKGNKSEKGSAGLMIGLEAGYQMAYKTGTWKYDNGDLSGGPDFCNNAFFIQLMIGGGGVMKK